MPYAKSKPLRDFEAAYADVFKRLVLVRSAATNPAVTEYVRAAAILLAHAQFENYFSDIVSTFATCLQKSAQNCDPLPAETRAHLFLSQSNAIQLVSAYQAGGGELDLLKRFVAAATGPIGSYIDGRKPLRSFSGHHLVGDRKYPSIDNLEKVFSRLGVQKIFHVLNAKAKFDCKSRLESLASLRTQLAHTASIPGVSSKDIKNRLIDVRDVARTIDRVLYSRACSVGGDAVWKTHAV